MDSSLLRAARGFYRDEMKDHRTYRSLAAHARDSQLQATLERIAAVERGHAEFWRALLKARGVEVTDSGAAPLRIGFLRLLQYAVNPVLLVSALELGETNAVKQYFQFFNSGALAPREQQRLRRIIVDELEHETVFRTESEKMGLSNVRDFVLGMNDGLVEILGAVAGLSAVYPQQPLLVAISGLIVGVAGALSMGIGGFISVRSQRQVDAGAAQRAEILFEVAPERAADEYRSRLVASGVPDERATEMARQVETNREALARLLVPRTEEGELRAGLFTGLAYLLGVAFPVLPYFPAEHSMEALAGAVVFAGLALAVVATLISLLSGIRLRRKVVEMLGAGLGAAALAYGFGALVQGVFGISV